MVKTLRFHAVLNHRRTDSENLFPKGAKPGQQRPLETWLMLRFSFPNGPRLIIIARASKR